MKCKKCKKKQAAVYINNDICYICLKKSGKVLTENELWKYNHQVKWARRQNDEKNKK